MRIALLSAALILSATMAQALERLTPGEFMDRAVGNTFTFDDYSDGSRVGIEQFLTRGRSVWTRSDGTCTYGDITLEGRFVCFRYNDDPGVRHCWVPYELDGTLLVQSAEGQVQQISRITQNPVICEDTPLS